jgi:hypothetical protein
LSSPTFAGDERRCREADHLPEREVPRHHGQHGPERQERDAAGLDGLVGEHAWPVLGVVAAPPGALVDLGARGADGLAHLLDHEARPGLLPVHEDLGRARHPRGALLDLRGAPAAKGLGRAPEPVLELGIAQEIEALDHTPGRGLDAPHRHGSANLQEIRQPGCHKRVPLGVDRQGGNDES